MENLKSFGERAQKCDRENREWRGRQIKPVHMWYLDLVVKCLGFIDCTNCTTFCSQKLCCGTVFLYKNNET